MIHTEHTRINNISAIEISSAEKGENLPLVILIHGFTSCKEAHKEQAVYLAQQGYRVLLPDAHLHGDHALPELEAESPIAKAALFDEVFRETSQNINKLIQHYIPPGEKGNLRVGLAGVSMGGFVILHHITHNRNEYVKAAVVFIATPYFENHLRKAMKHLPEFGRYISDDLLKRVRAMEPSRCPEKAKDLPLLFLPGTADEIAPLADVRKGVLELKKVYEHPERVKVVKFEGIGHECVPEMFERAGEWFGRWL